MGVCYLYTFGGVLSRLLAVVCTVFESYMVFRVETGVGLVGGFAVVFTFFGVVFRWFSVRFCTFQRVFFQMNRGSGGVFTF